MSKLGKPSAFKATVIAALLATALGAQAAGLGKLTVYSGIGQPLNAEVALTANNEELASLSAKLASHEAFREAGIEYAPALSGVRFNIAKSPDGRSVLKLTSDRPIDEPFLHFLVELNWSSGRMMREYTFLLDPPEMLRVAKPASVVAPMTPAIKALPAATAQPAAAPVAAKPRAEPITAGEYEVKRGDTLSKIARETKAESVSLDQMLVALFDSNRDAFDGNNMNRLRSGKILRIPEAGQVAQVDPAEARKLVIGQATEFNAYRRQLAEAAATAPAVAESAPRQQVSGAIKPQVEEKAPPVVAKDKLEVSRTEAPKTAKAVGGAGLEEDLIARDKALREASERIAMLEKNIENLKRLVEVKSQTGAKLQQESQATAKPAEAPPAPVAGAQREKPATEAAPAKPVEAPVPAAETPKPAEPAPATVVPPVPKPAVPPPLPPAEPSFVDENPQLVYGGGGLLALLLGYLGYSSWRRKKQAAAQTEEYAEPFAEQAEEPAAAVPVPPDSLEASEISIQSDFGESGALTAEEIVDPVAEADVLMAYGRDKQAEEILLDGMKNDPARTTIHMKLLDLYAKQENLAQFETVATELHKQNNGRGAEWEKALSMAHALGLSGGVFIGAAVPAAAEAAETAQEPAVAEAVAGAAAPEEAASLDFDLDLGTASKVMEPPATAVIEPVAEPVAATKAEASGLDFDFDLATPETEGAVEAAAEKSTTAAATENVVDFSFDLDLGTSSDTGVVAEAAQVVAGAEEPTETMPSEAPATEEAASAGEIKFDFDLDLDSGSHAVAAEHTEKEATVALPDINLDLDVEPAAHEPLASVAVAADVDLAFDLSEEAPVGGEAEVIEAASESDNPEVATKLELAQAYEEMGDLEGARELLNEVLNEGSAAQREQARAKLDQLSV